MESAYQTLSNVVINKAYDPLKTTVVFDGHKVSGSAARRKYVRVSDTCHELHLQVTSGLLQNIGVGTSGVLTIVAHAGGDRYVTVNNGILRVDQIYIKELTTEVPEVVVVLKSV